MKQPSDYRESTRAYYNSHAEEFVNRTRSADMKHLYAPFLASIPKGGRILDAGCGSGRDSLAFLQRGFAVLSIDSAVEMVKATSVLTGQEASLLSFEDIEFNAEFDGVWACASLLHVARQELPEILLRLTKALRRKGVLYVSFKHGNSQRLDQGRFFNDMTHDLLHSQLASIPELTVLDIWTTLDVRAECDRPQDWLNALVQKRVLA